MMYNGPPSLADSLGSILERKNGQPVVRSFEGQRIRYRGGTRAWWLGWQMVLYKPFSASQIKHPTRTNEMWDKVEFDKSGTYTLQPTSS